MTEAEYQDIVARYPDLDKTEKEGYERLCALCLGNQNRDRVLQFFSSLKDYRNDVDNQTTLNVVMAFLDDNDIHFIMGLDWRSAVEDLEWRIQGALAQNFGLEIDLPKPAAYPDDASVSYNHVFTDYDTALRNKGFQMSIINEGSDSYILLVHQIADKEEIVKNVEKIGYLYDEFTDDTINSEKRTAYVAASQKITPKKNYLFIFVVITLLCPVFSCAAYKGYLKEGLSWSVISVIFSNLIFYWMGINGIILSLKKPGKS